jgi:hypothetical protein
MISWSNCPVSIAHLQYPPWFETSLLGSGNQGEADADSGLYLTAERRSFVTGVTEKRARTLREPHAPFTWKTRDRG